jgi:inner membrane protein
VDPVSQAALGAGFAQAAGNATRLRAALLFGAAGGLAPDLDVFIASSTDPLLFIEYHRQFTHSLVFIPIGAALVTLMLWPIARRLAAPALSFRQAYVPALLGYATHGLLDACTSYGTQLLWPFSGARIAWNVVSVVDPLFTVPLAAAVAAASLLRRRALARLGLLWGLTYLLLGQLQHDRATEAQARLVEARGHAASRMIVKPSFANLLLWKSVYLHDGLYYVDALRMGSTATLCPGSTVPSLVPARDLPELNPASTQRRDIERFQHFSAHYLARGAAPGEITDVRYSMVPNETDALWGLRIDASLPDDAHGQWWSRRRATAAHRESFGRLLRGEGCAAHD